jgi:hypothetical protein
MPATNQVDEQAFRPRVALGETLNAAVSRTYRGCGADVNPLELWRLSYAASSSVKLAR